MRIKLLALPVAALISVLAATTASAELGLTYNSPAQLSVSNTSATVTGSVTCPFGATTVSIGLEILQPQGRQLILAGGSSTEMCTGAAQSWTIVAQTTQGQALKTGSASIQVSAGADNAPTFTSQSVAGPIRLTH